MTPSGQDSAKAGRWPVWKIALVLYPIAVGAAAVNLFFIGLLIQAVGMSAISPWSAALAGLVLGIPLAYIAGRYFRRLIDQAEADGG